MGQEQSTVGGGGFAYEDPSLHLNGRMSSSQHQTSSSFVHQHQHQLLQAPGIPVDFSNPGRAVHQHHVNNTSFSANSNQPPSKQQQQTIAPPPPEEVIDIYDTGVSEGLRALLATLHEDEDQSHDRLNVINSHLLLPPSSLSVVSESSAFAAAKLSPSAPEFVPGAPVTALRWNAAAPEFVPTAASAAPAAVSHFSSSGSASASSAVAVVSTSLVDTKTWYYRDPKGKSRGPFSTSEMKSWFDLKYFPKELMVGRDEQGPYISLGALFAAGAESVFAGYMDVREFNLKVVQQHQNNSAIATANSGNKQQA